MLEGAKEYFGQFFKIKDGNRMNPLQKENMPEYMRSVVDGAREALRQDAKEHGYGEIPSSIDSLESFFESAKQRVTEGWNRSVRPALDTQLQQWAQQLRGIEGVGENMVKILENPDVFESQMVIGQYGPLEDVRDIVPEIWLELVALGSDRQLAALVVAERWFHDLPVLERQQFAQRCGLTSAEEIDITIETTGIAGKFVDHAYIKQVELAVAPGGQMLSPLDVQARAAGTGASRGLRYVYDVSNGEQDGDITVYPFKEVFPVELDAFQKSLNRLAQKVESLVTLDKLPQTYAGLPKYLRAMAETYGSSQTGADEVQKQYEALMRMCRELAVEGCPIMLLPQATAAVAGKANKVDVEVRIGIRTKEVMEFEASLQPFITIAQAIRTENAQYCAENAPLPKLLVNYQPMAFGPNTFWRARGESTEEQILAHNNDVEVVAVQKALPWFRKMFPQDTISDEQFIFSTKFDNSLHELGHTLIPAKDTAVLARIGSGPLTEELKADSGNIQLVHLALEQGVDVNVEGQLCAKVGDICDYLKTKKPKSPSGKKYFYGGTTILQRLFDAGSVVEQGVGYALTRHQEGVAAIAALADEVQELYRTGSAESVEEYFKNTMVQSEQDPRIQRFMERLNA